jgi:broad specificity phosphatase PhoE
MHDDVAAKAGPAAGPAFAVPATVPDDAQLWLVRHGETEWSRLGRHTGRTDIELTDEGRRQAERLPELLGHLDRSAAYVISSPLARARETALLAGLDIDEIDPDVAEWDYGDYEGRKSKDIRAERPGWDLWTDGVPGGETPDRVAARADRVLTKTCSRLPDGPVVIVAHGHMCRMLGARWIGLPPSGGRHLLLGTAAPSLLSVQYGSPAIDRWNLPNPAT